MLKSQLRTFCAAFVISYVLSVILIVGFGA